MTLSEVALASGADANEFNRIVDPNTMVGDPRPDPASAVVSQLTPSQNDCSHYAERTSRYVSK
jgi:hypothetical protein